jgi:hypothetical protein
MGTAEKRGRRSPMQGGRFSAVFVKKGPFDFTRRRGGPPEFCEEPNKTSFVQ